MVIKLRKTAEILIIFGIISVISGCSSYFAAKRDKGGSFTDGNVVYIQPVIKESRQKFTNKGYGYHNNNKRGTKDAFLREFGLQLEKYDYKWEMAGPGIQQECENLLKKRSGGMVSSISEDLITALKKMGREYLVLIYNLKFNVISDGAQGNAVTGPRRKKKISFFCSVIDIESNTPVFFSSEAYSSQGGDLGFMEKAVNGLFEKIEKEKSVR